MVALTAGAFVLPRARQLLRMRGVDDASPSQIQFGGLTKAIAFTVVLLAGWYLCLPETDLVELPWWASKLKVAGMLVYEAVFMMYLGITGVRMLWRRSILAPYITLPIATCLLLLAAWCAVSSLLGPLPLRDVGRSARLILMALLLLAVTNWSAANPLFVLRTFLVGMVGASVLNLTLTFQNPVIVVEGVVPRLLGQNSPGPPMGIAVCLAAWLILLSRDRRDTILAMVAAVVCGAAVMISYSKTGMLAAGMGFVSLVVVSGQVASSRRGRVLLCALLALVLGGAYYLGTDVGRRLWGGVSQMLSEKLTSAGGDSQSVQERWSYVQGVGEIVLRYPVGVGYSGFRGAMLETAAYRSGFAADDASSTAEDSNPHSLFLYYASAGGLVGGVLTLTIFGLLCLALFRGIGLYGLTGVLLAFFCSAAYVAVAIGVAYLFNSTVMLIPAALSAGIRAHARGVAGSAARKIGGDSNPAAVS